MKCIHMSDTHLLPPGNLLHGIFPEENLRKCFDAIQEWHADARFVLITGDISEDGGAKSYWLLQKEALRLRIPVLALPGNHDNADWMHATFPSFSGNLDALKAGCWMPSALRTPVGFFIFLDTTLQGAAYDVFDEKRALGLQNELDSLGDAHEDIFIAFHHPPFVSGIPSMDARRLLDPEALHSVLSLYGSRVRHLFVGHLHRSLFGNWRGIPFSVARSIVHQVLPDGNRAEEGGTMRGCDESPEYNVVLIDRTDVVCHAFPFLDTPRTFAL
ncbi:MAG: metallophosphoesterase [Candidatus Accumulibacter sp.]|nr:metallophosphoesterase [Accumulibacter sp.]